MVCALKGLLKAYRFSFFLLDANFKLPVLTFW